MVCLYFEDIKQKQTQLAINKKHIRSTGVDNHNRDVNMSQILLPLTVQGSFSSYKRRDATQQNCFTEMP